MIPISFMFENEFGSCLDLKHFAGLVNRLFFWKGATFANQSFQTLTFMDQDQRLITHLLYLANQVIPTCAIPGLSQIHQCRCPLGFETWALPALRSAPAAFAVSAWFHFSSSPVSWDNGHIHDPQAMPLWAGYLLVTRGLFWAGKR